MTVTGKGALRAFDKTPDQSVRDPAAQRRLMMTVATPEADHSLAGRFVCKHTSGERLSDAGTGRDPR